MDKSENFHAGHRERLIQKFLANPSSVAEHELLEILLYPVVTRKNTNNIAHGLLKCFGNLEKIFSVSAEELMTVDGVGKRTAAEIMVSGAIYKSIYEKYKYGGTPTQWKSFAFDKDIFFDFFESLTVEVFLLVLLDKNKREITRIAFEDNSSHRVTADIPQITKSIAINKPAYVIIAHNHPYGRAVPSEDDDRATAKIYLASKINGAVFLDHVIIAGKNAYSYRSTESRLDYIEEKFDLNNLFKQIDDIKE